MLPNPKPTLAGFIVWFYQATGIPDTVIPEDSTYLGWGYGTAINAVNQQLAAVPGPFYLQAVYNYAADWVIQWAPDPIPPVPYPYKNRYNTPYMAFLRKQWNLGNLVPGVVQTSADQGTATSLVVSDTMKNFTITQLSMLRTPFGQAALGIMQSAGTLWGLS